MHQINDVAILPFDVANLNIEAEVGRIIDQNAEFSNVRAARVGGSGSAARVNPHARPRVARH